MSRRGVNRLKPSRLIRHCHCAVARNTASGRKTARTPACSSAPADTEPDGWSRRVIMRDWAKQRETGHAETPTGLTSTMNALDLLLSVDDVSRVGALRYRVDHGAFQRASEPGRRHIPPLIELADLLAATQAVERNDETAADLRYLRGHGTSLVGLRPKCSVVDDDGMLSIAKFPSISDERSVTKAEILALDLARTAGINAAIARLVHAGDVPVALIRRFDRQPAGRIMFVSASTLLGVDDDEDHAYTEIVAAMRQHGGPQTRSDIHELWRRLVFSVLITNTDDHLKNHGFLHVGRGQWRLSPAYDINPTPDKARELKTWISEDIGPQATIQAVFDAARYFGLKPAEARAILSEVERAVATWRSAADRLGMTLHEIDQFADAFEHEERVKAQAMLGTTVAAKSAKHAPRKSSGTRKRRG
jgi:serine/threonine-protein kinase HipA